MNQVRIRPATKRPAGTRGISIGSIAAGRWPVSRLFLVAALVAVAGMGVARPALAQNAPAAAHIAPRALSISMGTGRIIDLAHPASSIFAADPNIVEVRPASPTSLFMFGKGVGLTNVVATNAAGTVIANFAVTVGPSVYPATRLGGQATLESPNASVSAESEPGGMIVRGTVDTAQQAYDVMHQAKIIAQAQGGSGNTVYDELKIRQPIQVVLKVRIAQMSRVVTRELGIDWSSIGSGISLGKFLINPVGSLTGGGSSTNTGAGAFAGTPAQVGVTFPGGTLQGVIDALASDNLAHILAEPTLTTLSGTAASFQVGGQFPVPVASGNNSSAITVQFENYGVQLSFTPYVLNNGEIALTVNPSVSQIDTSVAATIAEGTSTIAVPGLKVSQATATVVMGSGQGLAIAGLLEDQTGQVDNAVPGIGEIPVLGALFRGDSFQRTQTELVITVTPYIVNPVDQPGRLALPDDGWTPPNDLERVLLMRNAGSLPPTASALPTQAGFMVQ